MFISELTLKNVLSFRDPPPLELQQLNVVIGANGSGKSNLIDCIGFLQALPSGLNDYLISGGGLDAWLWKGMIRNGEAARVAAILHVSEPLRYEIDFNSSNRAFRILNETLLPVRTSKGGLTVHIRRRADKASIGRTSAADLGPNESVLAIYRSPADPTPITAVARELGRIRVYRGFDTGPGSEMRRGVSSSAMKHPLLPTGANLNLVLHGMDFSGSLARVQHYLSQLSDRFGSLKFQLEGGYMQLYIDERGLGPIAANRLSDGTLKFLCLMAVLLDDDPPPLVAIDEPEAGLHPDAITIVADAIKEASQRMQIIVTTHSESLVSAFSDEPDAVLVCERDFDESTTLQRLSGKKLANWLERYSLGELWRKGEIGGTRW